MRDIAIRVEELSKQYKIGAAQGRHDTLRDQLAATFKRAGRSTKKSDNLFWALDNVSFEVKQGEVLGVIGRNGAGKSTLLKILSRITEPTRGFAELHGRVGSLLEVGTGFHPELTGRENIYLNGAIIGMKRAEIERKFDEIVAFAEVEKFIDTPVKRYSSGMYVRLAFAVAAHMDTEILLIDEVLAVGDLEFQKKCLGKMKDVAQHGRTVLFVSHNLGQIGNLCETALWLNKGTFVQGGPASEVIAAYRRNVQGGQTSTREIVEDTDDYGFVSWQIVEPDTDDRHVISTEGPITLEVVLRLREDVYSAHNGLILENLEGQKIAGWGTNGISLKPGEHRLRYKLPSFPVRPGAYSWRLSLWDGPTGVDARHMLPELIVATYDHGGLEEAWSGVVNIPMIMEIDPAEAAE